MLTIWATVNCRKNFHQKPNISCQTATTSTENSAHPSTCFATFFSHGLNLLCIRLLRVGHLSPVHWVWWKYRCRSCVNPHYAQRNRFSISASNGLPLQPAAPVLVSAGVADANVISNWRHQLQNGDRLLTSQNGDRLLTPPVTKRWSLSDVTSYRKEIAYRRRQLQNGDRLMTSPVTERRSLADVTSYRKEIAYWHYKLQNEDRWLTWSVTERRSLTDVISYRTEIADWRDQLQNGDRWLTWQLQNGDRWLTWSVTERRSLTDVISYRTEIAYWFS